MQNNKLKRLRKRHPKFIYRSYHYQVKQKSLLIGFVFELAPNIVFRPKIVIENVPRTVLDSNRLKTVLDNLVFHLGLIEMVSYWKAACPQEIIIKAGHLDKDQLNWWKNLIIQGLGQFFYENKIDWRPANFLKLSVGGNLVSTNYGGNLVSTIVLKDRYLLPFAGGRDSIVSLEKLKKNKKKICLFTVNPIDKIDKTIKVSGIKKRIVLRRTIDRKLLKLNKLGYFNGHTPFTAFLSFAALLTAVIFDYKNIVFSNEKSADEGNLKYLGRTVNHQWAKTSRFEKLFSNYAKKYLVKNIRYYSQTRNYGELEISKMLTFYPKYFSFFSSCNAGMRIGKRGQLEAPKRWCQKCPKCLFVYLSLYPLLSEKTLLQIFGKDLFEDKQLLPLMNSLLGRRGHKPFECVGTYQESRRAFADSRKKALESGKFPYLLKYAGKPEK